MARKRKVELKGSPKLSTKSVTPVRKSTRQKGKKYQDEQKGDESKEVDESSLLESTKLFHTVDKKNEGLVDQNQVSLTNDTSNFSNESLLGDTSLSDKISCDGPIWSEDVIEETIICEEMEFEVASGPIVNQDKNRKPVGMMENSNSTDDCSNQHSIEQNNEVPEFAMLQSSFSNFGESTLNSELKAADPSIKDLTQGFKNILGPSDTIDNTCTTDLSQIENVVNIKTEVKDEIVAPKSPPKIMKDPVKSFGPLTQTKICMTDQKTDSISNYLSAKMKSTLSCEDLLRDNEISNKDAEDVKASSCSENSNDTLSSSSGMKDSDSNSDNKANLNSSYQTDEKSTFKNRNGSTDTTGSESSSNSSGVRRSSRIKIIGMLKQRSQGRGLVTKPSSLDSVKTSSHLEKVKQKINFPSMLENETNQSRNAIDKSCDTQSDKENDHDKVLSTPKVVSSLSMPPGMNGYGSDSNKPVKVKSRWRQSCELEMSNSSSWLATQPSLGFLNSSTQGPVTGVAANSVNSNVTNNFPYLATGVEQSSKAGIDFQDLSKQSATSHLEPANNVPHSSNMSSIHATDIPKIVGAKISLPTVPVEADREMEERLSQFDHLKENLYLTDRITSKEAKKMLCDCFLTEDEIARNELGCGEDCLNRLLMIECGPRCNNGIRCTNKRFQNSQYAPCEIFRTEKKGFGLRATSDLEPGDFIMEYVGEVVDPRDFRKRAKEYSKDKNRHYYFMALKSDQIIDATMKGNISRFINHSCDPNAETQKWTVNGELRIGFFNKKSVATGEEITFDYHFQRYGKEAQKCFCESDNCRGWIGDNPNDSKNVPEYVEEFEDESEEEIEDNKEEKKEKKEKRVRKKRLRKIKVPDHMEDEDLEEQIEVLCKSGLKNRAHTLTLSRLMVRCREIEHRMQLLKVIQSGEQPCRRLFLDYHGLRLMWNYMNDVAGLHDEQANQFRLEIVKTLASLPIPNKSMLIDSKVLSVLEKWSEKLYHSPSADSPEDEQSKNKLSGTEPMEKGAQVASAGQEDGSEQVSELSANLLLDWANLKEVFRIPKKERIEQMKEHEREADRGFKEDALDRQRSRDLKDRGPPSDFSNIVIRPKRNAIETRELVQVPRMSKEERRQLFALKVAKEEEERHRRQQEDTWQQHQAYCISLGLDPYTTLASDSGGFPIIFDPRLGQWTRCTVTSQPQIQEQVIVNGTAFSAPESTPLQTPAAKEPDKPDEPQELQDPVTNLPPKWRWHRDSRGRVYYYHIRGRNSQWLPPPPEHIGREQNSSPSSSETSSAESSSEEDDEIDDTPSASHAPIENVGADDTLAEPFNPKRRRDGLVQERIISPRREEDRVDHKKYKETKEKLRRHKERNKFRELMKRLRGGTVKTKSHSNAKFQPVAGEMSPTTERKIKENFRINMANVMVHILNPYRKSDCSQGRITNTEDFKHLARKLTHFVLAKELKHCKSVDELECNDNVKHKAKDFVRKYMSKFGAVYQKGSDEV